MQRIQAKVRTGVRAKTSARPLPRALMEVYYFNEETFRTRAKELEDDPRFRRLMERGYLEKVQFRGKIPRHRYEDFKDRELTEFLTRYRVTETAGWEADFFDRGSMSRRQAIAKKYGCPVGELSRILRYCQYVWDLTDGGPSRAVVMDEESPDFLRFTPSPELFDVEPLITRIEAFTRRYQLDRERFACWFFTSERDPEAIAEELGATVREVEVIRGLVERIQTLNSLQMDVGPSRMVDAKTHASRSPRQHPVAEVELDHTGTPRLRILADDVYDCRYRFHEGSGPPLTREEGELVQELRAINQRRTVLVRLVGFLYRKQYRWLATGRPEDLVPLTQAACARELEEEEATVSRIIRDKVIRTPWGTHPFKFFFTRIGKVVEILLQVREARELADGTRARPYTDSEIQQILAKEYGIELSRRSITYHRNRFAKSSNFYARKRKAPEAPAGT